MGIERNGSIANCFTWVKKSWNNSNASIVSQSESYVTMSDKTTVHNETGFLLHKGRLQMYIGDTPNDTSDLTGRIMTSMTSNGVAKWSKSQDVIGTYEYIDLLNIASPNVTIDSSKMLHMIMFDNISTGGTNLWTSYYDKSVNLILPNAGVDYDGNEHTFIFKANEIFGRLADATYMKITSADSSVLYQMTAKEKSYFSKLAIITVKVKCMKQIGQISNGLSGGIGSLTYRWKVIHISNTFQSGGTVNDTLYGDKTEDIDINYSVPSMITI
jgi:hypothetical protein